MQDEMKWNEKRRRGQRTGKSSPTRYWPFLSLCFSFSTRGLCVACRSQLVPQGVTLWIWFCASCLENCQESWFMIHDSLDWIESDIFNAWLSLSESVNQWISNVMYLLYNSPLLCWCWLTVSQLVPLFGNCYIASVQWHSYIWVLYFAFRHLVRFLIAEAL